MKTLAQAWEERLAVQRKLLEAWTGEHMSADEAEASRRQHAGEWWAEFCMRADAGELLSRDVWKAAAAEGRRRGGGDEGWVARLKMRNAASRVALERQRMGYEP